MNKTLGLVLIVSGAALIYWTLQSSSSTPATQAPSITTKPGVGNGGGGGGGGSF